MAKIARFEKFYEAVHIVGPKDVVDIDLMDPNIASELKFVPTINYRYKDIMITLSHALQSHMEDEGLRYGAVFSYGDYDNEGNPTTFDWVVHGKTPQDLISELKRMIPEYIQANPKSVKESEENHDQEWSQLTKDEKVDKLMAKLNDAVKKKNIKEEDAEKIRERMDKEIKKSGPDKIRHELMKRAKEEENIKKGSSDSDSDDGGGRLDKARELAKQELWKGYKQPVHQFFDTMLDLMSGD